MFVKVIATPALTNPPKPAALPVAALSCEVDTVNCTGAVAPPVVSTPAGSVTVTTVSTGTTAPMVVHTTMSLALTPTAAVRAHVALQPVTLVLANFAPPVSSEAK